MRQPPTNIKKNLHMRCRNGFSLFPNRKQQQRNEGFPCHTRTHHLHISPKSTVVIIFVSASAPISVGCLLASPIFCRHRRRCGEALDFFFIGNDRNDAKHQFMQHLLRATLRIRCKWDAHDAHGGTMIAPYFDDFAAKPAWDAAWILQHRSRQIQMCKE